MPKLLDARTELCYIRGTDVLDLSSWFFVSAIFDNDVAPHVFFTQTDNPPEFKGGESSNNALTPQT